MWFKLYAMHGGGHQGQSEDYFWRVQCPSHGEREDMWHEWVRDNYIRSAKGGVSLVRELPEKVRLEKIEHYKHTIVHAQQMLKVLGVAQLEPFILG